MRSHYTCPVCSKSFSSYNPNPTYCSRSCKVQSQITAVDVGGLRSLYLSGHSQQECADLLGVTQKVIHNTMRRHGIPTRKAAKRNQWGANNHMWKGDDASIYAMHVRVYNRFGKDNRCSVCGTVDPDKWYDWANLTGSYGNSNDYQRMCRSCHRQYDNERRRGVMPNDA